MVDHLWATITIIPASIMFPTWACNNYATLMVSPRLHTLCGGLIEFSSIYFRQMSFSRETTKKKNRQPKEGTGNYIKYVTSTGTQ